MFGYSVLQDLDEDESCGIIVLDSTDPETNVTHTYLGKCVKKLATNAEEVLALKKEGDLLEYVKGGPFIVNLHAKHENDDYFLLVLDMFELQDLQILSQTQDFFEDEVKFIGAELVVAFEYLHSIGVAHTCVKMENVGVDYEGHIAVLDFDESERYDLSEEDPEMIERRKYREESDWYCLGHTLHTLLTRDDPRWYQDGSIELTWYPNYCSVEALDFLNALLFGDPDLRLGVGGAIALKQHPFFEGIDWDEVRMRTAIPPASLI